jgi:transketolase
MNFDKEKINVWSKAGPKLVFGNAMEDACENNKDVIVLAADLAKSLGVYECRKFPNQYYNLGICEQNMIGIACGLAKEGKIPVASSFVPFITLRALEQIRTGVCYMNLNVKLVGGNAGVKGGKAGVSHYGLEDITVMRCLPNMVVLSPSDGLSMYKGTHAMIEHKGPVYMRLTGVENMKIIYDSDFDFKIGESIKIKEGEDVIIFATGSMVAKALDAAAILKGKGIDAGIFDVHTIKPLDRQAILNAAERTPLIVSIEEHTVIGGLGGAIAELLAQSKSKTRLKILGLRDKFMEIAPYEKQLSKCGLLAEQIAEKIEEELRQC